MAEIFGHISVENCRKSQASFTTCGPWYSPLYLTDRNVKVGLLFLIAVVSQIDLI
jgi:hypothetical protein